MTIDHPFFETSIWMPIIEDPSVLRWSGSLRLSDSELGSPIYTRCLMMQTHKSRPHLLCRHCGSTTMPISGRLVPLAL